MLSYIVLLKYRITSLCRLKALYALIILSTQSCISAPRHISPNTEHIAIPKLAEKLQVGDIIFIRATPLPFKKIAHDTNSWTNHVGIIVGEKDEEPLVAESTFPFSQITTLSRFLARSENGQFAIRRLNTPLTKLDRENIATAAKKRVGILYDTGFNLHSKRQFCSRYVNEVIYEATHVRVGEVTTLSKLLENNPDADMGFWRLWYLGRIPWDRQTITPVSMLQSDKTHHVLEGYALTQSKMGG